MLIHYLREYCRLMQIKQGDLAKRSGLSKQLISRVFKTGNTTTDTIEKLYESLGLSIYFKKTCKK